MLLYEGVSQNYARKYHIPIDKLDFQYDLLTSEGDTKMTAPSDGAYIYVRVSSFLSVIGMNVSDNKGQHMDHLFSETACISV